MQMRLATSLDALIIADRVDRLGCYENRRASRRPFALLNGKRRDFRLVAALRVGGREANAIAVLDRRLLLGHRVQRAEAAAAEHLGRVARLLADRLFGHLLRHVTCAACCHVFDLLDEAQICIEVDHLK